jgi:chromosome segregation ATPase
MASLAAANHSTVLRDADANHHVTAFQAMVQRERGVIAENEAALKEVNALIAATSADILKIDVDGPAQRLAALRAELAKLEATIATKKAHSECLKTTITKLHEPRAALIDETNKCHAACDAAALQALKDAVAVTLPTVLRCLDEQAPNKLAQELEEKKAALKAVNVRVADKAERLAKLKMEIAALTPTANRGAADHHGSGHPTPRHRREADSAAFVGGHPHEGDDDDVNTVAAVLPAAPTTRLAALQAELEEKELQLKRAVEGRCAARAAAKGAIDDAVRRRDDARLRIRDLLPKLDDAERCFRDAQATHDGLVDQCALRSCRKCSRPLHSGDSQSTASAPAVGSAASGDVVPDAFVA